MVSIPPTFPSNSSLFNPSQKPQKLTVIPWYLKIQLTANRNSKKVEIGIWKINSTSCQYLVICGISNEYQMPQSIHPKARIFMYVKYEHTFCEK